MYARVVTAITPKEKWDAVSKLIRETNWPATKKQKGYKGYLTLWNTETGEGMTVSLWDTEANMLASEKAAYYGPATSPTGASAAAGAKISGVKHYEVGLKD